MKNKNIITYEELFGAKISKAYTYSPEIPTDLNIGDTVVYKDESGKYNQIGEVTSMESKAKNYRWIWVNKQVRIRLFEVRKCYPAI